MMRKLSWILLALLIWTGCDDEIIKEENISARLENNCIAWTKNTDVRAPVIARAEIITPISAGPLPKRRFIKEGIYDTKQPKPTKINPKVKKQSSMTRRSAKCIHA